MKKQLLILVLTAFVASGQTNTVVDPSGNVWSADSDMGFYWAGFGTGMVLFGFGMIFRMAKRSVSDF